jgi:hypothetical protein
VTWNLSGRHNYEAAELRELLCACCAKSCIQVCADTTDVTINIKKDKPRFTKNAVLTIGDEKTKRLKNNKLFFSIFFASLQPQIS